jgi:hypothetical protein
MDILIHPVLYHPSNKLFQSLINNAGGDDECAFEARVV